MKILVVGTGSIGQRHVKNILSLGHSIGIFSYRGAKLKDLDIPNSDYEKDLYTAIESKKYQAVVVANKNIDHIPVAIHAAKNNKHLYIEKPLSNNLDKVDELKKLCSQNNIKVETGFMPDLVKLCKENIKMSKKLEQA